MSKIAVAVTTYKKPEALRGWLDSCQAIGSLHSVAVCDDNDGETKEIVEEYKLRFPFPLHYLSGERQGIAGNKNRGIQWFLSQTDAAPYLLLSDDDIKFSEAPVHTELEAGIGDRFIRAYFGTGLEHITGYLGNYADPLSGNPFFEQFPPIAEDDYLYHCGGSQGLLLFFTRNIVEKVGYFSLWRGVYGYEHVDYSMRCGRMDGRCPELYPILKHCNQYFRCQGIGNNYSADPKDNEKQYFQKRVDAYVGVNLRKALP